jgi:dephospho-CoA kinase
MTVLANRLRSAYGPSYIIDQLYERANHDGHNCVIESIRTPGEIQSLRRKPDFYLFAVDATARKRYNRIKKRGSETDTVSFKEFVTAEEIEMSSDDPHKQNLARCIDMADYRFDNNGSIEQLLKEVKKVMTSIKKEIADGKRKD